MHKRWKNIFDSLIFMFSPQVLSDMEEVMAEQSSDANTNSNSETFLLEDNPRLNFCFFLIQSRINNLNGPLSFSCVSISVAQFSKVTI